jgi:sugar phosphate isomerase/epimerase
MKLSAAVSTPDAKFSALALKGDFDEIFALVKRHGLHGAEIHVRDPRDVDAEQLKDLKNRHGLEIPAIGTGRAFGEDGLCFSDPDPAVRRAAVVRIKSHADLAHALGSHIIIGLILGKNPRTPEIEKNAADCMRECADYAADRGVDLFVEPINRYETGFIITARDCLSFFETVDRPNCKVLLDTFHMNIEEADMCATIRMAGARIGHVHVADSNRWHPGAGHIDFAQILAALHEVNYAGFLSAEMFPNPDPETAIAGMAAHLRPMLERLR